MTYLGKISSRLWLRLSVIIAALLVLYTLASTLVNIHTARANALNRIEARLIHIRDELATHHLSDLSDLSTVNDSELRAELVAFGEFHELESILVQDAKDRVIGHWTARDSQAPAALFSARGLRLDDESLSDSYSRAGYLFTRRALVHDGQKTGSISVSVSLADAQKIAGPIMRSHLQLAALFLFLGVPLAAYTIRHLTSGISQLANAVRGATRGNLDFPVLAHDDTEVGELSRAYATMIEDLRNAMGRANQLAYFDKTTELPNQDFFRLAVQNVLEASQGAKASANHALLVVTIDALDRVTEFLGQYGRDMLLRKFGANIRRVSGVETLNFPPEHFPDTAHKTLVARQDGGDFAVFMRDTASADDALALAHRIIDALAEPMRVCNRSIPVAASIGIALSPENGTTYDMLFRRAGLALTAARESGRNKIRGYTDDLVGSGADTLSLEQELAEALDREQIEIFLQPQVHSKDGTIDSAEALARWRHPKHGMVPPGKFIPLAEKAGLIEELGYAVLWQAACVAKYFANEGQALRIGVNVSALQFNQEDFAEKALGLVRKAGVQPQLIELEITESTAMGDFAVTAQKIDQLRQAGFRIAIDDFGTGYSNLSYLASLSVDALKIDRSFVSGIDGNRQSQSIIGLILGFAEELGYETVGEGAETASEFQFLGARGCDRVQGYFLSRPLPVDAFIAFVRDYDAEKLKRDMLAA